jgi:hypothetical protein
MSSRLKTNPEKMFKVMFFALPGRSEFPLMTLMVMNTLVTAELALQFHQNSIKLEN